MILLLISVALDVTSAVAQCVLDPIHVQRIEGYVVFGFQNQYRILDKAEIRVLTPTNSQPIASGATDKDGHFEILVKPGKYILSVRSEAMIPASVDVEVVKGKGTPGKQSILVVLAADATKECGGASIRLQPKTDVDRMLSTAKRPAH